MMIRIIERFSIWSGGGGGGGEAAPVSASFRSGFRLSLLSKIQRKNCLTSTLCLTGLLVFPYYCTFDKIRYVLVNFC